MTHATIPTATEMMTDLRANLHAQGERALAVQTQWMDWQQGQLGAWDAAIKTAFDTSRAAFERTMTASYETSKLMVDSFAAAQQKSEG